MAIRRLDTKKVIEYFRTEDLELADLVLQVCKGAVIGRQREEDDKVIAESEAVRAVRTVAKVSPAPKVPQVPKISKVVKKRTRPTKAEMASAKAIAAAQPATNGAAQSRSA